SPAERMGQPARTTAGERGGPALLGSLIAVSWLGLLLHLAFDSLNNYGVRPFLPFSSRWLYGDLVFIVDPWFWLLLGAGLHLGLRAGVVPEAIAWLGWAVPSYPVPHTPLAP